MEKVLKRFNMENAKPVMTTALSRHFKSSKELGVKTNEENKDMESVPYSSTIGSLMYTMVSTRANIAHIVEIVNRFMQIHCKEY